MFVDVLIVVIWLLVCWIVDFFLYRILEFVIFLKILFRKFVGIDFDVKLGGMMFFRLGILFRFVFFDLCVIKFEVFFDFKMVLFLVVVCFVFDIILFIFFICCCRIFVFVCFFCWILVLYLDIIVLIFLWIFLLCFLIDEFNLLYVLFNFLSFLFFLFKIFLSFGMMYCCSFFVLFWMFL